MAKQSIFDATDVAVEDDAIPHGFDITVEKTIGRVVYGEGPFGPLATAFGMIGSYLEDAPNLRGVFSFPDPTIGDNVGTVRVTVESDYAV